MARKKPTQNPETEQVDVELIQEAAEEADFAADAVESHQMTVETTSPAPKVNTYTTQPGDSYASLAASLCPAGTRKHDYAKALAQLNGLLRPGKTIQLP